MSMMSQMNNSSRLTEAKPLSAAATAPNGILQSILNQIPVSTAAEGWHNILFSSEFSPWSHPLS